MSRAFVREQDAEPDTELPDAPPSPHPNYITEPGLEALRARLAARLAEIAQTAEEDDTAGAQREIRRLQARISAAIPVALQDPPRDRVAFGATVTVTLEDGRHERYRIVGEDEVDIERAWLSWISPLGRALQGAQVGDTVLWKRPAGDLEVEIVAIDYEPCTQVAAPPAPAPRRGRKAAARPGGAADRR